jgi:hypothetical protein
MFNVIYDRKSIRFKIFGFKVEYGSYAYNTSFLEIRDCGSRSAQAKS